MNETENRRDVPRGAGIGMVGGEPNELDSAPLNHMKEKELNTTVGSAWIQVTEGESIASYVHGSS